MAEKDFQTELLRGLALAGGHAHKLADVPFKLAQQARFIPKKPYDCYWLAGGVFHALELKQVAVGLSFSLSGLQDHQEQALIEVEEAGGRGFLAVNFRVRLSEAQRKKRGLEVLDRAFAVRIPAVVRARIDEARAGLPLEWWESHAWEFARVKTPAGMGWAPGPLWPMGNLQRAKGVA